MILNSVDLFFIEVLFVLQDSNFFKEFRKTKKYCFPFPDSQGIFYL